MGKRQKRGKKSKKNKPSNVRYRDLKIREKHKVKRILRANGQAQAEKYAAAHGWDIESHLKKLLAARSA